MSERKQSDFFRLRPEAQLAAWMAVGMAIIVILDQHHYWSTREDFSFGYLVPFFVGYVLNDRWPRLKSILLGSSAKGADGKPAQVPVGGKTRAGLETFAAIVVVGSLLMFLYGGFLRAVTGPDNDSALTLALGLGGFILAMGFLVSRTDAAGREIALGARGSVVAMLVFPALAWLISAPILLVFETRVKPILLEHVVEIVSGVMGFLGYSIERQGSVLVLPHGSVGVADACSGIRSLTACLFAGSFLAAVFFDRYWKKVLLLVMSAMLAFVMNIFRSLFLTWWAYSYGSEALDADFWGHPEQLKDAAGKFAPNPAFHLFTVHDFAGYSVLACTLAGLLLLIPLLNFQMEFDDDTLPPTPPTRKPA